MFGALGFFLGCLLALMLAPPLWNRAVKLTTRKLEATMPMSLNDIQADKDQLRAEFAIELRKVEVALEKAKEKATRELIEANKRRVEIAVLNTDLATVKGAAAGERERQSRAAADHQAPPARPRYPAESRQEGAGRARAGQWRAAHHGRFPVRRAQDRAHDLAQSAFRHRALAHGAGGRRRRRHARSARPMPARLPRASA